MLHSLSRSCRGNRIGGRKIFRSVAVSLRSLRAVIVILALYHVAVDVYLNTVVIIVFIAAGYQNIVNNINENIQVVFVP